MQGYLVRVPSLPPGTRVDERDFRKGNRERCASCFTLAQKNAQVVGTDRQAALRDLRPGIKSESLERVGMTPTLDRLWKAPVRPGLSFMLAVFRSWGFEGNAMRTRRVASIRRRHGDRRLETGGGE